MNSLQDLLRNITDQMYRLNDVLDKRALSERDIKDEENNYLRFLYAQEKLYELLPRLQNSSVNDKVEYTKNLIELYKLTDDFQWYFENLHESVNKIIRERARRMYLSDEAQLHEM